MLGGVIPIQGQGRGRRVGELEGLRGLLALWVVVAHGFAWTGHWENPLPGRLAGWWLGFVSAEAAVDTFMILSGFAIACLLEARPQGYAAYLRERAFRIYPVYIIALLIALACAPLSGFVLSTAGWRGTMYFRWIESLAAQESGARVSHLVWHLALLHGLPPRDGLPGSAGTVLAPAWSITLEWQYYLIAPFLWRLWRSSPVVGWIVAGGISLIGIAVADAWRNPQLAFLPSCLPLFLVGVLSHDLYRSKITGGGGVGLPSFVVPLVLTFVIASGWHVTALVVWTLTFGAVMVRGDDMLARGLGCVRSGLGHPLSTALGRISYPLYLVHWPVLVGVLALGLWSAPSTGALAALVLLLAVGVPLALWIAWWIHRGIERPAIAWGRRAALRDERIADGVQAGERE
jgi:peptidoglycan/LPS O-acetylase OafA/YrhL